MGLPGSGKGEASQIARQQGLPVLVMGDVIREEAAKAGLENTDLNLGRIGTALRAKEGPAAVAERILERARSLGKETVVVDGLRSKDEADFFRAHVEEFHLIEVCAPPDARLKWLASRGRPDDPKVRDETDQKIFTSCRVPDRKAAAALEMRECRELSWGMSEALKTADLKLRNDGSLEDFQKNVEKLLVLLEARSAFRKDSQ